MRRRAAWGIAGALLAMSAVSACADRETAPPPAGTTSGSADAGADTTAPAAFEPGEERPGGDTTIDARDAMSFLQPAANLPAERRGTFEAGLALFDVAWTVGGEVDRDGLGPTYVGTSCRSCHFRGGRGAPPPKGQPMTSMLIRLSVPSADGSALVADPRYGDQLQTRAIPGVPAEGWFSVEHEPRPGAYPDGAGFDCRFR